MVTGEPIYQLFALRSQMTGVKPILSFPTPFPGEFFGGIVLRYHRLYGARNLNHTLFNNLSLGRGAIRNLPTGLRRFAEQTAPIWPGGVDEILEGHTVWPVYRPFLTALAASRAYHRIAEGPAGSLQLTLGDATARLKLQPCVQGCPICLAEDALQYGYGYLHVDHQLPGVRACHLHRVALITALPADDLDFDQNWRQDLGLRRPSPPRALDPGEVDYATLAATLRAGHMPRLTPKLIALTYSERLQALGLLTAGGHLRSRALAKAVVTKYSRPMLNRLGISRRAITTWMPGMLHRQQRGHHTVKHMLLIGTLFGDVNAFLDAIPQRELPFDIPPTRAVKRDISAEVAAELKLRHGSVTSMAKRLGISTTTCTTYAKRAGAKIKLRPKTLGPARLRHLARKIARGVPVARICSAERVSVSTVYRVIKSDKAIERARKKALENKVRKKHRAAWEWQLRHLPRTSSAARKQAPNVYAWLYRHDPIWLRNSVGRRRAFSSLHQYPK